MCAFHSCCAAAAAAYTVSDVDVVDMFFHMLQALSVVCFVVKLSTVEPCCLAATKSSLVAFSYILTSLFTESVKFLSKRHIVK